MVGVQRDRDGIGHRVRDARELGRERPAGDGIAVVSISMNSASRSRPCSSSFDLTMPSVSRVPQTSRTPISRMTYGSAPM